MGRCDDFWLNYDLNSRTGCIWRELVLKLNTIPYLHLLLQPSPSSVILALCNAGGTFNRCTPRRVAQRKWEEKCNNKSEFHKQIEMRRGKRGGERMTGSARCPKMYATLFSHSFCLRLKWKQVNLIWKFWKLCGVGWSGCYIVGGGDASLFSSSLINVLPLLLRWQNKMAASRKSSERQGNWIYVCKLMNLQDIRRGGRSGSRKKCERYV